MNFKKSLTDEAYFISTKKSKNRAVMLPMATSSAQAHSGLVNDYHLMHYGVRALNGIGTIIVEATAVDPQGIISKYDLGLYEDKQIAAFQRLTNFVHSFGTVIGVQLNHAGAKAGAKTRRGVKMRDHYNTPFKYFSVEDLKGEISNKFFRAAQRAAQAGFDFIEIHAAHGYLWSTFLHPETNEVLKTDDLIERAQIFIDLIKKIKKEIKLPLGIRVSFVDNNESGIMTSYYQPLIKILDQYLDYWNVSSGGVIDQDAKINIEKRFQSACTLKTFSEKNILVSGRLKETKDINKVFAADLDFAGFASSILENDNFIKSKLLKEDFFSSQKYPWRYKEYFLKNEN